MSDNDVPMTVELLTTPELLAAVPISRARFFTLREKYPFMLRPARTTAMMHFWKASTVEMVRSILKVKAGQ